MNLKKYFLEKFKDLPAQAGKKVLILGFAREGKSTLNVFGKYLPGQRIDIADRNLSKDYLINLNNYDVVFKSPGIPNKLPEIKLAKKKGVKFTSQTKIFLEIYRDQIIGVTGTKGKSTTASLICHVLKTAGKDVELVGNIGKPVFDYLDDVSKDKIFVAEFSSHQLSDVDHSPHIAVLLNIFPEHLDYYEDFDDYKNAKENIFKLQKSGDIYFSPEKIDGVKLPEIKTNLVGKHNTYNIKASYLVSKVLGISDEDFNKVVATFTPLEDRLEKIGIIDGVEFVLDGLATIPEASFAAIDSFSDRNLTLILGGFDRGIDFSDFTKKLNEKRNIKNIILIGQVADKLEKLLINSKFKVTNLGFENMENIVKKSFEISKKSYVVLFSPAATSFDMFKDYKDRDEQFRQAVKNLQ